MVSEFRIVDSAKKPVYLDGVTDERGWVGVTRSDIVVTVIKEYGPRPLRRNKRDDQRAILGDDGQCYPPKEIGRLAVELKYGLGIGFLRANRYTVERTSTVYPELGIPYFYASECV